MKMDISTGVTQGWAAPGSCFSCWAYASVGASVPNAQRLILGLDDAIREREANR